ncbi:hypothetical protein SpCBS45565_g01623 [Spizellomyces sp. 'palustris']|nr:hypothetical protein SpCBS45565_g01623 [Spizellomyces sp. 'palustris']
MLRGMFPNVCSLLQYLETIGANQSVMLDAVPWSPLNPGDPPKYHHFLKTTMVARSLESKEPLPPSQGEVIFSQSEIVNSAIEKILKGCDGAANVLTFGYRKLSGKGGNRVTGTHGIENFFPNTIVNYVKAPVWEMLLGRIGVRAMTDLLLNTTMFMTLQDGCYVQISGVPVTDGPLSAALSSPLTMMTKSRKRHAVDDLSLRNKAGKRVNASAEEMGTGQRDVKAPGLVMDNVCLLNHSTRSKPVQRKLQSNRIAAICFAHRRIFYTRPVRGSRNSFIFGLPKTHVLNRYRLALKEKTRLMLCYIFPRQFDLENVFTYAGEHPYQCPPEFHDRERDLEAITKRKLPWRLKRAEHLVNMLITLHQTCNFRALLDFYCPSPVSLENDSSASLDMLRAHTSFYQVTAFLRAVIHVIIPFEFFGTEQNREIVVKGIFSVIARFRGNGIITSSAIGKFVRLRRYENMSLQSVITHFKINDCSWVVPPKYKEHQPTHIPLSDMEKRKELILEFLYWMVDSFVIPLLKTTFYATESAPYRNKVFYFRHDVWSQLTGSISNTLSCTVFRPIDQNNSMHAPQLLRSLGYSYIRLLPKDKGVRMITNLRRRFPKKASGSLRSNRLLNNNPPPNDASKQRSLGFSINTILQNAFQILTYEKTRNPALLGGSVLGLNEIYGRLKAFQHRLMGSNGFPRMYFCKVDVASCFDTIDQTLLLSIIRDVFQDDEYVIQKYSFVYPSAGRLKRTFLRRARPSGEFPQFVQLAKKLAEGLRNTIFVDQMGKKLYKQVIGIPQGSVLSTLLCSFFYAHMEQTKLSDLNMDSSLLLRYVDDFLFITTVKEEALKFLRIMHQGHPSHGCFINPKKTLANFEVSGQADGMFAGQVLNASAAFPWCGLLIDTRTLNVKADYSRFDGTCTFYALPVQIAVESTQPPPSPFIDISDTLTVETALRPGSALRHKLFQFLKPKCHAIFLDTNMNSTATVLLNIHQNLHLCAMKFYAYVKSMNLSASMHRIAFLYEVIKETIRFTYMLIRSRANSSTAVANQCRCSITATQIDW